MTIEEVSAAFAAWRSNKQGSYLIPEALWAQVRLLQTHYSRSRICKALQINYVNFDKHCGSNVGRDMVLADQEHFVEVPIPIIPTEAYEITLQGSRRALTLKVPNAQLSHVLPILEGYL